MKKLDAVNKRIGKLDQKYGAIRKNFTVSMVYETRGRDEIMTITNTQVLVTACMNTKDRDCISIRQSTEAEEKLSKIYSLLNVNPNPLGKIKSVVHLKPPSKKRHLTIR